MEHSFNLVDQPWIPVANLGLVSLQDIFSNDNIIELTGNPIQKIALLKLLLAIAQSAYTPENEQGFKNVNSTQLAEKYLDYLKAHRHLFDLYDREKPFLQFPVIKTKKLEIEKNPKEKKKDLPSLGALLPEIATGNTTVLKQIEIEHPLTDAEKAVLLIQQMAFALGGKKVDNRIILTKDYDKKTSGKSGSSLAFMGLLHNFYYGNNLQQTIWLNLFSKQDIANIGMFPEGVGIAPWERMPEGEDCDTAKKMKGSLMGRLVPMGRFCLLDGEHIYYTEGIIHQNYLEGIVDPSASADFSAKKPKVLWANPEQRPWRELPAFLSFLNETYSSKFVCQQLKIPFSRVRENCEHFSIFSGGLRVTSNAGEQYVSGNNDYVESKLTLHSDYLNGDKWFLNLSTEMESLDDTLSKILYACVMTYFKQQQTDGKNHASQACNLFWQYCEHNAQELINLCAETNAEHALKPLRKTFANYAMQSFNHFCPADTTRQLAAWAKAKPNFYKYINS